MAIGVDVARPGLVARALVSGVQVLALATVLGFSLPRGFPLDDAWIHQVVARVFAETGVLGFDPSLPGSGATSLLWTLLLSSNAALLHVTPPLFTTLLAGACLLGVGQLFYVLATSDGLTPGKAVLGAVAFGASGNVVWFATSGMEVTLAMLLALTAVWAFFRDASPRSAGVAGVALVLLFYTRPETALLGLLLAVARRRGVRDTALLLGPLALGVGAYAVLNVVHTGHLVPVTFQGRRWLAEVGLLGATPTDVAWVLSQQWFDRLAEYTLGTPSPVVFFPVLGLALYGVYGLAMERRWRLLTLCGWALLHTLSYVALLPSIGHGGRYQPFVPGIFCLGAVFGALRLGECVAARMPRPWGSAAAYAAVVPLAFGMTSAVRAWGEANALAVRHEDETEVAMARDVAALPRGAVVASFDIGAMGYYSGRSIEDLGGLVRPDIVPFLRDGRTVEWLRKIEATHLVLPLGYRSDLPEPFNFGEILGVFGSPDLRLSALADHQTPLLPWLGGVRATSSSAPRQRLYRIIWQRGAP